MNEQPQTKPVANFIELPPRNAANIKREKVLMAESQLGERANGSNFFETAHGVFPDFGSAEKFAMGHFKAVRWLVADRVTRDDTKVTYDFITKPRSPRRFDD